MYKQEPLIQITNNNNYYLTINNFEKLKDSIPYQIKDEFGNEIDIIRIIKYKNGIRKLKLEKINGK
jgi:hypothetical protein